MKSFELYVGDRVLNTSALSADQWDLGTVKGFAANSSGEIN